MPDDEVRERVAAFLAEQGLMAYPGVVVAVHRFVAKLTRDVRVAALREAESIVVELREDDMSPRDLRDARDSIRRRVEEVERG